VSAAPFRVGFGFDMHRLVAGRPLVLGGIMIPFAQGLEGDSDADVLTHAVLDALLGAAGLGDIGTHFGVGRPENMGIASTVLLARMVALVRRHGFRAESVDATLVAEAPRLSGAIAAMRARLAEILGLAAHHVNLKSTTAKRLGALGAGEGIAAFAVATLSRRRARRRGPRLAARRSSHS
jgi:2-C-methyl-D-erythritol 2,4-cyclodiphosphate synthase